jgi:hypothetical protein
VTTSSDRRARESRRWLVTVKAAPRRRRPVDGRRATDGVGVHGDPCPGDVDTVGRDMAHGVGLDGRVGAGMAGNLAPVGVVDGAVAGGEPGALRRPPPPPATVTPARRVAVGRPRLMPTSVRAGCQWPSVDSCAWPVPRSSAATGLIADVQCDNGVAFLSDSGHWLMDFASVAARRLKLSGLIPWAQ